MQFRPPFEHLTDEAKARPDFVWFRSTSRGGRGTSKHVSPWRYGSDTEPARIRSWAHIPLRNVLLMCEATCSVKRLNEFQMLIRTPPFCWRMCVSVSGDKVLVGALALEGGWEFIFSSSSSFRRKEEHCEVLVVLYQTIQINVGR